MLRKLLIAGCLLATIQVSAQTPKGPDVKFKVTAEDNAQAIGAALPPFVVITMPQPLVGSSSTKIKKKKSDETGTDDPAKMAPPKYITNKDVQYEANLLLMFFNPTCGHCQDMTELLEHHMQYFHKTKVLMVAAPNARDYMAKFEKDYSINQYSTLIAGTDSLDLIKQLFAYKSLPQFNIYNKDRKLIKVFSGDIPIDSLKPYIQ